MNQTGQAKYPFPLTRILFETQSWDSADYWISGMQVLKPILIRTETPFFEVIFSFSAFCWFRCISASHSELFGDIRAISMWINTRSWNSVSLSGRLISDNSPSFDKEVAHATQTQFTHVSVLIILAMCYAFRYANREQQKSDLVVIVVTRMTDACLSPSVGWAWTVPDLSLSGWLPFPLTRVFFISASRHARRGVCSVLLPLLLRNGTSPFTSQSSVTRTFRQGPLRSPPCLANVLQGWRMTSCVKKMFHH